MEAKGYQILRAGWSDIQAVLADTLEFLKQKCTLNISKFQGLFEEIIYKHGQLVFKLEEKKLLIFSTTASGQKIKVEFFDDEALSALIFVWQHLMEKNFQQFEFSMAESFSAPEDAIWDISYYIKPLIHPQQEDYKKLEAHIAELKAELEKLEEQPAEVDVDDDDDDGEFIMKYGLPNAPHRHLFIFPDGHIRIFSSQEEATAWLNSNQEKPLTAWELKKRTIIKV